MGMRTYPAKAKLITAVMVADQTLFEKVRQILEKRFGPIDSESDIYPFTFTDYYSKEMGTTLHKKIISFHKLIEKNELVMKKLQSNKIEEEFAKGNADMWHRRVNIDPGYVTDSKLVLASTKNFSHRIYLGDGIFAEVTLRYFRTKGFEPLEWTYPDYRTDMVRIFLESVRQRYMGQLRSD